MENKLLDLLIQKPGVKTSDAAQAFQISYRSCYYLLDKLRKEGKLTHKGSKKVGYWEVKTENIGTFQRSAKENSKDLNVSSNDVLDEGLERVWKGFGEGLEIKMVDLMIKNPKITQAEMVKILDVSKAKVEKMTKLLSEKGIIERKGGKRYGYWKVNKADTDSR